MAQNTVTIVFQPCGTAPAFGYRVSYRPVGGVIYRVWPDNFFASPIVFTDSMDPEDTEYEGFIQSDCGGGKLGPEIPFSTIQATSGSEPPPSESESEPVFLCQSWVNITEENVPVSYINCVGEQIETEVTPTSGICAREILTGGGGLENTGPCLDRGNMLIQVSAAFTLNSVTGITHDIAMPISGDTDSGFWEDFNGGLINLDITASLPGWVNVRYDGVMKGTQAFTVSGIVTVSGLPDIGAAQTFSIEITEFI